MTTVNFGFPYIVPGQAQKDVTHNQALDEIDAVMATLGAAASPAGVQFQMSVAEVTLALSGASVSAVGLLPDRAIVKGVVARVTTAITGAASFSVGDAGDASRFGGSLPIAFDSENVGVVGPYAVYADTDVIVTANGGSFTGGAVRLTALLEIIQTP